MHKNGHDVVGPLVEAHTVNHRLWRRRGAPDSRLDDKTKPDNLLADECALCAAEYARFEVCGFYINIMTRAATELAGRVNFYLLP